MRVRSGLVSLLFTLVGVTCCSPVSKKKTETPMPRVPTSQTPQVGKYSAGVKGCVWGNTDKSYYGITLEECKERCSTATSFTCNSLEYHESDNQGCHLSRETRATFPIVYHSPCLGRFADILYLERISILTVFTTNAVTNRGLSGMVVSLMVEDEIFDEATVEASSGRAELSSPHGPVVITGELAGFQLAPVHINVTLEVAKRKIELSASPENSDPARVVLNWGSYTEDLDLHVKQLKDNSVVCHSYFEKKKCDDFALVVDTQEPSGGETITWEYVDWRSEYVVYVHDFKGNNGTSLGGSGARIAFYGAGQSPVQVNVPAGGDTSKYWIVGCFNRDRKNGFSLINELTATEPSHC